MVNLKKGVDLFKYDVKKANLNKNKKHLRLTCGNISVGKKHNLRGLQFLLNS